MRRLGRARSVVVILVAAVVLAGCDWTSFGFGPQSTNFNPSEPALTESSVAHLKVAWSASCECSGQRPLVVGGVVYAIDGYGPQPLALSLRAFDAATGTPKWSTFLGPSYNGDRLVAVGNGLVYVVRTAHPVVSMSDQLVAVDAGTGAIRWQVTPPAAGSNPVFLASPIVDGSRVFVAATSSGATLVSALDTNGQVVWSLAVGGEVFGDALAADPGHTLYIASTMLLTNPPGTDIPLLTSRAESDGTLQSAVVAQIANNRTPPAIAYANGLVYGTQPNVPGCAGVGAFALHPDTGTLAWSADSLGSVVAPSAVLSRTLGGAIRARDPSTGAVQWQAPDPGGAQAVAGNLVYSVGAVDTINVRRISDGTLVGTVQPAAGENVGWLTPSAGHIYDAATNHVYALAPS